MFILLLISHIGLANDFAFRVEQHLNFQVFHYTAPVTSKGEVFKFYACTEAAGF